MIRIICFCTCNNEGFVSNSARQQLPRVTRGYAVYRQLDESLLYLFWVKWQFSSQATRRERKTQAYCRTSGFSATEWRTTQDSSWSQLMTVITAKKLLTVSRKSFFASFKPASLVAIENDNCKHCFRWQFYSCGGQNNFVRFLANFSAVPASLANLFHFSYLIKNKISNKGRNLKYKARELFEIILWTKFSRERKLLALTSKNFFSCTQWTEVSISSIHSRNHFRRRTIKRSIYSIYSLIKIEGNSFSVSYHKRRTKHIPNTSFLVSLGRFNSCVFQ